LTEAQQGLCVYCEQRIIDATGQRVPMDYQVEHVHPKSGAVGRVLSWKNLALACCGGTFPHHQDASRKYSSAANTSCGQKKANGGLAFDPRRVPLLNPPIEVNVGGELIVNLSNCRSAGLNPKSVADALELLNLNCERLRKTRQDRRDNINTWLVPLLDELLADAHLVPAQRQQTLGLLIAGRLQTDNFGSLRAWWTTERNALGPDADFWISDNQGMFV